ncbi:MAG: hypothetical protein AAF730_00250 [Bacteroidota bacterium]
MPNVNSTNEHILAPVLLFILNVTVVVVFYLGYELIRLWDIEDERMRLAALLTVFTITLLAATVSLKFRQRGLLIAAIILNVGALTYFFA